MANTRLRLTVDNATAYASITKQGYGQSWPATSMWGLHSRSGTTGVKYPYGPGMPAYRAMQQPWKIDTGCEFIEALGVLTVSGEATLSDETTGAWTVNSGSWRQSPNSIGGLLGARSLELYTPTSHSIVTATVTNYGSVTSVATYPLAVQFAMFRSAADDNTDPMMVVVQWAASGGPYYALTLPVTQLWNKSSQVNHTQSMTGNTRDGFRGPTLYGRRAASGNWTALGRWEDALSASITPSPVGMNEYLRIEHCCGYLVVRWNGPMGGSVLKPWVVGGDWVDANGETVTWSIPSAVTYQVESFGQRVFGFNMTELAYGVGVVEADQYPVTPDWISDSPTYTAVGETPAGTSMVASTVGSGSTSRPKVTLTGSTNKRPVLYSVNEVRLPTLAAGVSNPVVSAEGSALSVVSARGTINDTYRGNTCTVDLVGGLSTVLDVVKTNSWAQLTVLLDDSATGETRHIFGCVLPQERTITDPTGRVTAQLQIVSPDEARLRKKLMLWHPSYAGRAVDEAFHEILHRCGIPDALIAVDPLITSALMGANYYLPTGNVAGKDTLLFDDDCPVTEALDTICAARGLEWGSDVLSGLFFLRKPVPYSGVPDWIMDAASVVDEDVVVEASASEAVETFANVAVVVVGDNSSTARVQRDTASIEDDTAPEYIGDDWWVLEKIPDGDDTAEPMKQLWKRHNQMRGTIRWKMAGQPGLMPGHHVQVNMTTLDIVAGTVFRITTKDWNATSDSYEQTLTAVALESEV